MLSMDNQSTQSIVKLLVVRISETDGFLFREGGTFGSNNEFQLALTRKPFPHVSADARLTVHVNCRA